MSNPQNLSTYLNTNPDLDSALNYVMGPLQYTNFYYKDPAVQDPKDQLVLGQPPLPGNRTFLDIKQLSRAPSSNVAPTQCYDASGNPHNLSVLIDTVQKNAVLNHGLLYSLYASVKDFDNGISNPDISSNPYLCKPVQVPISDNPNSPSSDVRYVPLKEGFSEYEKNPLRDPIVWFYFASIAIILCAMILRKKI
jgi:hypothetical protein